MLAKDLKPGEIFRTEDKVYFVNRAKWEKPGITDLRCKGVVVDKKTRERFVKAELAHVGAVEVHIHEMAKVKRFNH